MTDDETYVRFGPGVPASTAARERRPRRWILPLTVLILAVAVLIYFLWGRGTTPVAVDSIGVKAATPTVTCGQTERLTAVITTNGGAGTLTYQWTRSDGTRSDVLSQNVSKGDRQATVSLLWDFDGPGTYDASATVRILSPGDASASAAFRYVCDKS